MHLRKTWLSLFVPLGKTNRFPGILCDGKCSLRRHSTVGKAPWSSRWTAEEDRKLEDLVKQGLKLTDIAKKMEGRTYQSINIRKKAKRIGLALRDEKTASERRPWSAEEDALMLEKLEQGRKPRTLKSFFPGRTLAAVDMHSRRLRQRYTGQRDKLQSIADPRIQRIIDMRVKEAKHWDDVASELGLNYEEVQYLWRTQCVKAISKGMLEQVRLQKKWSPNEKEHLLELHRRATLGTHDVALQFPSKTSAAVRHKISRMKLRFPRRYATPGSRSP
jgi:hypothetical protein